ncbi:MAG: AMP-binding protein [Paracoccaceae bacterium]|nr:AMP-binding protein [Paracoccaceae bacterium]
MHAVFQALRHNARTRPDAIAFRDDNEAASWAELATRVARMAQALQGAPGVIGLGLSGGISTVVADLAVTLCGRRLVPLPFFFSAEQQAHVICDAGVGAVITEGAVSPGLRRIDPKLALGKEPVPLPDYPGGAERVIYTSGSSGRPKGVVLADRQLGASIAALSSVMAADTNDRHLSVLPLAQLLEQICGIFLPILAGAETVLCFGATKALFGGPIAALSDAMTAVRPTTSLLAPALLGRWVADLVARDVRAPDSLRFVAVGGAATPPALLAKAAACGIPVYEGYGLSECCAVVAMNRPGDRVAGSVGRVLDGLVVTIEGGEIVVAGPTVMQGYLNGPAAPARWHTGDRGHFAQGRLVVEGRRDALLITGAGRNISPEWVEARINADPRVVSSALCLRNDDVLVLLVAVQAPISLAEVATLLADLPAYARPAEVAFVDPRCPGLLFPAGTPNRAVAADIAAACATMPIFPAIILSEDVSA